MVKNGSFSEEGLRKIAEQKVNFRFSVKIHAIAYIIVNIILATINLLIVYDSHIAGQSTIDYQELLSKLWVIYPLMGWGIGLAIHITSYLLYAKGVFPNAKRAVIYHIVSYLSVILFLLVINQITNPEFYWVFFPAFFWGAGVIAHYLIYKTYFSGKIEKKTGEGKTKKEKAIEKEMQKMRKKITK